MQSLKFYVESKICEFTQFEKRGAERCEWNDVAYEKDTRRKRKIISKLKLFEGEGEAVGSDSFKVEFFLPIIDKLVLEIEND